MYKSKLSFLISIFFISLTALSCKSNKNMSSESPEIIFSLNTTSCLGECPVFELALYGDKKLVFEGKEHTALEGVHKKNLSDEQFDKLMGIIETANWVDIKPTYRSNMTDLPTENFIYNRNGVNANVSKYGSEPKELREMTDLILTFMEDEIFGQK